MNDDFDAHLKTMEACGNALGFALAAALREKADLSTSAAQRTFALHLDTMADDGRFSADVTIVISGIADGMLAFDAASTNDGELI